ncbi:alpha/beta fold hydrolase [Bacillus sp. DJP31]|uniref:alpha/beta fold hydrolase n=1 Tax=Bacillus sp. DJP31 TaxID=3409789 RepID=UPI003BB72702
MPIMKLEDGVELYYEDAGQGKPILFIHGVWMSSRFFQKQIPYFSQEYRVLAVDLRGHGRSSHVQKGHTVANYARDLRAFIGNLDLKDVTLVGWSMGAFVVWEYLHQFGEENVKATVIVDELASDFKWPDFEIGAFDFPALIHIMREVQTNRVEFLHGFIPLMFKEELNKLDLDRMLEEVTKIPESIASAILFDQSVVDCRPYLSEIKVPTLLCFGREEKLIPVAAGEHLLKNIQNSRLEIFENSCHCPFLEEADLFNEVVDLFIRSLD